MNTIEQKVPRSPYISVAVMQRLLSLLGSRSFSQLTFSDLESRDFSRSEAFQALQGLRFLGFLDGEGKVQNTQVLSLRGDARTNGLKEIVKKAYAKIFEVNPDPAMLPKDELHNEFVAAYNLSPRLARPAVPLFLWLCKEAGMQVSEEITPRIREKQVGDSPIKYPIKKQNKDNDSTGLSGYHSYDFSGIKLFVPKNAKNDLKIVRGGLSGIVDKILEFVGEKNTIEDSNEIKEIEQKV